MLRVDSCLVPPGLIASARMYSLVLEGESLYMIFTGPGPASQVDYSRALLQMRQDRDVLVNAAVKAVVNNYLKAIQATEAKINPSSLQELCQNKQSRILARSGISEVKLDDRKTYMKFSFKADGKKYSFDCSIITKEELQALAGQLAR